MATSQTSYEQNLMPLVYVDKITLENNSAATPPSDNPHIVDTEADVLRSEQIGIVSELNFRQTVLADAQTQSGCEVTVDMILKDNIENTALSSWFYDAELLKYMHLKIVQSTSKSVTQRLITGQFAVLEAAETSQHVEVQVMELSQLNYESIKDFYSVSESGRGKVADIPYQAKFFLNDANPSHLAYFAYCFFDIQRLIEDYSLDMYGYSTNQGVLSKSITSEIVINNGSVVSTSYVFYLPSGELWTGPVHQHSGVWMVGASHTSEPHPILTRRAVINSTVQDFRDFDIIIAPEINLDPLDEIETLLRNLNILGSQPTDGKESAFFSDAYIMRNNFSSPDAVGGTSLLFSFDINEFMRQKSAWGKWLYSEEQLPVTPTILSLKVYRHRAKSQTSYDRLGSPVAGGNLKLNPYDGSENPPVLIIDAHGQKNGTFEAQATSVGSIRQIRLEGTSMNSFMVTDYSLDNVTDGLYQYSVEIQVQDGAREYLTNILNNLRTAISHFQTYYDLSRTPDYYDASTDQFKTGFLNHYGRLNLTTQESMPWVEASARLLEALRLMNNGDASPESNSSLLAYFMGLCNPQTGTPKGIYAVLKAMESVETSLAKIVGSKSNLSEKSGGFGSSQNTILIDTQRFTSLVNSEIPDNYGQSFLELPNKNTFAGPPVYTVDDYIARVQRENEKYFSTEAVVLPSDVNEAMGDAATGLLPDELRDLSSFGATYLTAVRAINGSNTLALSSNVMQNTEKYRKFSLPLLMAWLKSPSNPFLSVSSYKPFDPKGTGTDRGVEAQISLTNTTPASMKYLSDMGISIGVTTDNNKGKNVSIEALGGLTTGGFIGASDLSDSFSDFAREPNESGNLELELPPVSIFDGLASSFASDVNLMQDTNYEASTSFAAGSPTEQLEIGMFQPTDVDGFIEGVSSEYLRRLPNQIKSLFLSGDPSIAKYPWFTHNTDVIRDPLTALMFIWNYQNIAKVEYLSTYESGESGTQVASPQWRELTFSVLTSTAMAQRGILCRLIPYYDTKFKVGMSKYAQLPYYENYFIITEAASNLNSSPSLSPGAAINFPKEALALWNSFSDVPSSGFMSTAPGSSIPLNASGDVEVPYVDPFPSYEGEQVVSLADALYDEIANVCSAAIVGTTSTDTTGPTETADPPTGGGGGPDDMGGTGGVDTGTIGGTTTTATPDLEAEPYAGAFPPVIVTTDFPEPEELEDTYSYNPEISEGLLPTDGSTPEDFNYTEPVSEAIGEFVTQQQQVEVSNSAIDMTAEQTNSLIEESINQTAQVGGQSLNDIMDNQAQIDNSGLMSADPQIGGSQAVTPTMGTTGTTPTGTTTMGSTTPSSGGGY